MSHFTNKGHVARATLEATCFQSKAILDAMAQDSGSRLASLAVDGGVSNSDLAMQTQADLSGIPVCRPQMRETTALGAAIAAGLAAGVWSSISDLEGVNAEGRTIFRPKMKVDERQRQFSKWTQAVEMSKGWDSGNFVTRSSQESADRMAFAHEIARDICCLENRCVHGRDRGMMHMGFDSGISSTGKWQNRHWLGVIFVLLFVQYWSLSAIYAGGEKQTQGH